MMKATKHTALLTALHLLVDGLCACTLMMLADGKAGEMVVALFVVYNVVAFATQPLTGGWIDRAFPHTNPFSAAILTLLLGAMLGDIAAENGRLLSESVFLPFISALLLGTGNSLFHVYGGKYVAAVWNNDIRAMGVFVSTGAVGLTLGLCFSSLWLLVAFALAIVVLAAYVFKEARLASAATSTLLMARHGSPASLNTTPHKGQNRFAIPVAFLLALMFVVSGRSFLGQAMPPMPVSSPALLLLVSTVAMMGKAAGGFLSVRLGLRTTLVGSLLLASAAFLLCPLHVILIPFTVFLVNLSMPCTLYLACASMPRREGLAFGLLAAALLPGYWLGGICLDTPLVQYLLTPLLATILVESVMLLYMRERRWRVLCACVLMNIFTNVPLNLFLYSYDISSSGTIIDSRFSIPVIGLECLVLVVEYLLYRTLRLDRRTAFSYSAICNATSYLLGLIFQILLL